MPSITIRKKKFIVPNWTLKCLNILQPIFSVLYFEYKINIQYRFCYSCNYFVQLVWTLTPTFILKLNQNVEFNVKYEWKIA